MQVARLVDPPRELLQRRRRPGLGPERGDHLVAVDLAGAQQLRPGALLGAELAQAKLAAVGEPDQHPGGAVAKRGALVEHLQAARRHQVDEQGQRLRGAGAVVRSGRARRLEVDHGHLPDPPHAGDPPAREGARAAGRRSSAPPSRAPAPTPPPRRPATRSSRRAVISTSGSSGIEPKPREARQLDLVAVHSPGSRLAVGVSRAGEHRIEAPGRRGDWSTAMQDLQVVQPTAARRSVAGRDRAALATRSGRWPRSETRSSSPTTTSCPRSRTSPTTWATRSGSRARRPPPTPT